MFAFRWKFRENVCSAKILGTNVKVFNVLLFKWLTKQRIARVSMIRMTSWLGNGIFSMMGQCCWWQFIWQHWKRYTKNQRKKSNLWKEKRKKSTEFCCRAYCSSHLPFVASCSTLNYFIAMTSNWIVFSRLEGFFSFEIGIGQVIFFEERFQDFGFHCI